MILGITGAFGCGKSTLLAMLESAGFIVVSADAVCHELYAERDPEFFAQIKTRFGGTVFHSDGSFAKEAMAMIAFSDPGALCDLTAIVYPRLDAVVDKAIADARSAGHDLAVEMPLLFETGFERKCDRVVALYCAPEIRRKRLHGRGFDDSEIARRDARQLSPEVKLERADFGMANNGSPELLKQQLSGLLRRLKNGA